MLCQKKNVFCSSGDVTHLFQITYLTLKGKKFDFTNYSPVTICEFIISFVRNTPGTIFTNDAQLFLVETILSLPSKTKHDIEFIINDEEALPYFKTFLKSIVCLEIFECWQVLDQFRKIDPNDQEELKRVSGIIWKKYLSTRSETEVNIGEEEKKMAENKDLTPFKYEEVQKSLFKTLKLDSFIQFLKSQEYANYFIEHVPTDIAPLIINEFKEILSKLQQPRYQVIKTFFIVLFKTLNMEKK